MIEFYKNNNVVKDWKVFRLQKYTGEYYWFIIKKKFR